MSTRYNLSSLELRVLGCLIEKEITTPDQYPLSLNAVTNACNQKSNRDPVMNLSDAEVQDTLAMLKEKRMIAIETGFGSRVAKYRYRFCNTEFGELKLSDQELGVLCVLFLRGPQTPGELRTRTNRLCEFSDVSQVEAVLVELAARQDGPFVMKLDREPGKRESRFAHLLGSEAIKPVSATADATSVAPSVSAFNNSRQDQDRISELEERVAELEQKVGKLMEMLE